MTGALVEPDLSYDMARKYWEGFEEEELRLPRCDDCEKYHWYPLRACPHCRSTDITWTKMSGRSTLFTWVGVKYDFQLPFLKDKVPLNTGLVVPDEAENVRLPALIVSDDEPEIGMPLKIDFVEDQSGLKSPVYRPK